MKGLSAVIMKMNTKLTLDQDVEASIVGSNYIEDNFYEEDMEYMIFDEEGGNFIAFVGDHNRHKIDGLVQEIKNVGDDIVEFYGDITNKLLAENDFSDYKLDDEKIKKFIISNTDKDDVLDKMCFIGVDKLTDIDKQILAA
jgi:hypothetical protein